MKDKIMKWFKMGLWTEEMVKNAFIKGVLTEADISEILGGAK
jgi:hypothetical protein